jgi:hypothetical protein
MAATWIVVSMTLHSLGLDHPAGYSAVEVFSGTSLGTFQPSDTFTGDVNPTGNNKLFYSPRFCFFSTNSQKRWSLPRRQNWAVGWVDFRLFLHFQQKYP